MKNWKVLVPVSFVALGTATVSMLLAKKLLKPGRAAAPAAAPTAPAQPKPAAPAKEMKTDSYSFISGYQDAATVELKLSYDPDKFSFAVVEDEFLTYSSDSHVAAVYGEDFNLQLEYGAYYQGEDFDALSKGLNEKYQGFGTVSYGANTGVKFLDGDNVCFCFPIPEDASSYILVTLIKAKDNDEELADLPENAQVKALLGSMSFTVSR